MRIEIKASQELAAWAREHIRDWLTEEFDPELDRFVWSDVDSHVMIWIDDSLGLLGSGIEGPAFSLKRRGSLPGRHQQGRGGDKAIGQTAKIE